ncbi:dipeptide ABC transporter ATP-binding protein [Micromonospora sp. NPDC048830]|uniref:dipeptide ABC transporter ATP-binding protein n=1 Tax=Micromonospora sp. NPDC048830 TaxID=3364257 RepID=UPI00371ACF10
MNTSIGATSSHAPLLAVRNLTVERRSGENVQAIVSSVNLAVGSGEAVGIVGESGSGKSVTARAIAGLLPRGLRATGSVELGGSELLGLSEREWRRSVRGSEIGLIMQDPFTMLNPIMRCGDIVAESLQPGRHRTRRQDREEAVRRLAEVGITDPTVADRYPFQLSGGMRQRVGIAAALARDPRILIADEPSTALDVTTQRDILALIKRIQAARGMGLILITHDLRVAFSMCDRAYVLYAGTVLEQGPADELDTAPLHPYSQALLLSEPPIDRRLHKLVTIAGSVPSPDTTPRGCVFGPRCTWVEPACGQAAPALIEVAPGRKSACLRILAIRPEMEDQRREIEQPHPPVAPAGGKPFVATRALSKVYGTGVRACDDVSIEVRANESIGIVGESGSGKTSLARMLVGLEEPTGGSIVIDGIEVTSWQRVKRADRQHIRSIVQIVFQDPYSSLNPMRTVGWTLREAVLTHRPETVDADNEVARLLDEVGLDPNVAQRRPGGLSGGMRQRVAIARALATRPRLLICDESVSALDVSVQAQVLNLLGRLRGERGIGYVFITHDLAVVRQVTERVYVMHRGRVVESGPTDRVIDAPEDPYTAKLLASAPRGDSGWLTEPTAGSGPA